MGRDGAYTVGQGFGHGVLFRCAVRHRRDVRICQIGQMVGQRGRDYIMTCIAELPSRIDRNSKGQRGLCALRRAELETDELRRVVPHMEAGNCGGRGTDRPGRWPRKGGGEITPGLRGGHQPPCGRQGGAHAAEYLQQVIHSGGLDLIYGPVVAQTPYQFFTTSADAVREIRRMRGIFMTDPMLPIAVHGDAAAPALSQTRLDQIRGVAEELEATFLAEMLKHAGFGDARGAFGGGAGEEQFASLLRMEHAQAMAATGGIGLAESLFDALLAREGGT